MIKDFMKAKAIAITGAILAALFPMLSVFGVEIGADDQVKIIGGITTIVGIIVSLFGESPAQSKIDSIRQK